MTSIYKPDYRPLLQKGQQKVGGSTIYDGSGWPVDWAEPNSITEGDQGDFLYRLKSGNSKETPGWDKPKARYISVPKPRPSNFKKPVQPVLHYPVAPDPPIRRPGFSDSSFIRAVRKYGARRALWELRCKEIDLAYARRYSKYESKLQRYYASQLTRKRISDKLGKAVGRLRATVNNPYDYFTVKDTMYTGFLIANQMCQVLKLPRPDGRYDLRVFRGPGPKVYESSIQSGTWGDYPLFWPYGYPVGSPSRVPNPQPQAEHINIARRKSSAQFHQKVESQVAHVGNMLAEVGKTYSMFSESIDRLQAFLRSPKKTVLDYVLGKSVSKKVGNDFIQYCFGVEPFVKDVYALGQELSKQLMDQNKADMVKVRSGGSHTDLVVQEIENDYYREVIRTRYETRVRHMVEYRVDATLRHSLNAFGMMNPASVLWEITPWSFVIDWFLPISNFVSALSSDTGLRFVSGTESIKTKIVVTYERIYKTPAESTLQQGVIVAGSINRIIEKEWYERKVLSTPPVVQLPRFKSPFSGRHFLLSLALWRQRF